MREHQQLGKLLALRLQNVLAIDHQEMRYNVSKAINKEAKTTENSSEVFQLHRI